MDAGQDLDSDTPAAPAGRAAQRRRTRAAIVRAATRLVAAGRRPSVDDVAAAADVSRRTVYLYFPTFDQLLLDATAGALSEATVHASLHDESETDVGARVDALLRSILDTADVTLPLGRQIIALTVDGGSHPTEHRSGVDAAPGAQPRRGYRRTEWIERAIAPLGPSLTAEQHERLAAALSVVIGWEAMIVLRDLHGLPPQREQQVLRWMAHVLVAAMSGEGFDDGGPKSLPG